jgi:ABC-2 type transport system permease protein
MPDIITLLRPRLISIKNSGRVQNRRGARTKSILLTAIGVLFWAGLFALSRRVLTYFRGIEDIGDILNFKLLSMVMITAFALLIFSSILTNLSKLYLSRDLQLVHSMPISSYRIFIARWIDATIDSSWMVIIYILPIFMAYGIVYRAGPVFYLGIPLQFAPLALTASSLGAIAVMLAVRIVPASRMKSIFIFLSILFFVVLYMAIRLIKPETLVDPDVFDTVLVYVTTLQAPSSPFLPTTWVFDALRASLEGKVSASVFHTALMWSFTATLWFVVVAIADRIYFEGFSKTQTSQVRLYRKGSAIDRLTALLPGQIRAYATKEIKTFLRDQSQWSQLFLIAALVFIYVYNFKVLPLERSPIKTAYLQNLLAFLNMGLALFVLTAITGRFAYPAVSTEKDAFWLVKTSPGSLRNFLWIKFFIYYTPLLVLTEFLILATNILLDVTPFMMFLSTATVFFLVPGIVAIGIGIGAAYPDFKAENPTQSVTSYGGLLFMILSAGLIIAVTVVEAGPVYHIFMADFWEKKLTIWQGLWAVGSFAAVVLLSLAAVFLPMRFGEVRLSRYQL